MARIMSRSRATDEGSTKIKFSEIIVIALAIGVIAFGVRAYLVRTRSASAALESFVGAIKAGNVGAQYDLLDDQDKKKYYPKKSDYESNNTLAHGYTERVETSSLGSEENDAKDQDKVAIPLTTTIRNSAEGKQLYEITQKQSFSDRIVMRKRSDGTWRVVLSESIDKNTHQLHLQKATPSPQSMF